jgi:hypothetical protein
MVTSIRVPVYNYETGKFDPAKGVDLPVGDGFYAALESDDSPLMVAIRKRHDEKGLHGSRGVRAYLRAHNIHLGSVYSQLGFPPERLRYETIRAVQSNDKLRPFFPPLVEDGFRLGILDIQQRWEPLIGETIDTQGDVTAQWYTLDETRTAEDYNLRGIGQAAEIPVATIKVSGKLIELVKKGRGFEWTDEANNAPVPLAQLYLRVAGIRIGQSKFRLVALRLLNGYFADGSDAPPVISTNAVGVWTQADLLKGMQALQDTYGYPPTDLMVSPNLFITLTTLTLGTGALVWPNGVAAGLGLEVTQNGGLPDDVAIIFNRQAALVRYVAKEGGTEDERQVRRQVTGTFYTETDQILPAMPEARIAIDAS